MNYTSIEQSKKLLELGLSPESADMIYWIHRTDCRQPWEEAAKDDTNVIVYVRPFGGGSLSGYALPCWSVGALLEVMPNIHDGISYCYPQLSKFFNRNGEVQFVCAYVRETLSACAIQSIGADTQIEAAYNMVVWLLENNYIKQ